MRDYIKNPIKTVFLGSSWESVETLKALHEDSRFEIVGAITTVDKPQGRKQVLTPSDVKAFCIENNIAVFHTEKSEEKYREALDLFNPELIVCKAFGEIVPKFFLEYPKYKAINIHFSILPEYRGAVPIQKAILDGKKKTGISVMLMSEGLDEGDILKIYEEEILDTDTNQSLRERLVKKSADILGDVLEDWVDGKIEPVKQDSSKATYCWQRDIAKENAQILWEDMDPEYIERMVRAFIPWPVAWTMVNGKLMKIFESELVNDEHFKEKSTGEMFVYESGLYIKTKEDNKALRIISLQIEGKSRTSAKDYINGLSA
jgi:methionyl-tRNA formyltransferase